MNHHIVEMVVVPVTFVETVVRLRGVSVVATCNWVFMVVFVLRLCFFFFLQSTLSGRARLTILSHCVAAASPQPNA